jgi:hypothetical protein
MLKVNKFLYNIKLFAIIYDYLETAHMIHHKRAQIHHLKQLM